MEFKVVVSDPETGKSYQREVKDEKARRLGVLKVGDEFDGSVVGLTGYVLKITGGSDKAGFPLKKGVHGFKRMKVLMEGGVGYRPKRPERRKKTVHGERISEDVVQINSKIVKRGSKSVEELLGVSTKSSEEDSSKTQKQDKKT